MVVKVRNDIVHGNAVISQKLCYLMTTFVNILALKLFNIKCAMYIPLIKRNEFTHEFLEQFILSRDDEEVEEDTREIDDQPIEVEEINGKLYLPLESFNGEEDVIHEGDKFRLLEFETKEYGEDCKLNLKMARFVKQ